MNCLGVSYSKYFLVRCHQSYAWLVTSPVRIKKGKGSIPHGHGARQIGADKYNGARPASGSASVYKVVHERLKGNDCCEEGIAIQRLVHDASLRKVSVGAV